MNTAKAVGPVLDNGTKPEFVDDKQFETGRAFSETASAAARPWLQSAHGQRRRCRNRTEKPFWQAASPAPARCAFSVPEFPTPGTFIPFVNPQTGQLQTPRLLRLDSPRTNSETVRRFCITSKLGLGMRTFGSAAGISVCRAVPVRSSANRLGGGKSTTLGGALLRDLVVFAQEGGSP